MESIGNIEQFDVVVIGGGAAGLMAAGICSKRNKKVLLIEATSKIGEKIRISGGGRCNFTNLYACHQNYLSENPHFVKSALSCYTQHDFIKMVESHSIAYHEKTLGQLFCDKSSSEIINMLVNECQGVKFLTDCKVTRINKSDNFNIETTRGTFKSNSLIVASGGLSIPKIGASSFGYDVAKQFGHNIIPTRPALVPLLALDSEIEFCKSLAGISIYCDVSCVNSLYKAKPNFKENILFTHKGLSGPAILQISSYLNVEKPQEIVINLLPEIDIENEISQNKDNKILLNNFMKSFLPNRFADSYFEAKRMVDLKPKDIEQLVGQIKKYKLKIGGSEGYLKAEVTAGGVDTKELSSKTMESRKVPGLYFIGEVVDVTGWLGGYNFQWAWSSGHAAGSFA